VLRAAPDVDVAEITIIDHLPDLFVRYLKSCGNFLDGKQDIFRAVCGSGRGWTDTPHSEFVGPNTTEFDVSKLEQSVQFRGSYEGGVHGYCCCG
jgi:hypothetical protein